MKVTYPRVISIQLDREKPVRFTDAGKAAEYWARAKEDEWVEKVKGRPEYQSPYTQRPGYVNQLYGDGRIRYRKLKRRALRIFRQILSTDK
jgi:hypothetical protein